MKFANRRPPSASVPRPSRVRSNNRSLPLPFKIVPVPECAKISPILPTEITLRPAALAISRTVGNGGVTEKSLRLPLREKSVRQAPTKGRAAEASQRSRSSLEAGWDASGRKLAGLAQAQTDEIGQAQRPGARGAVGGTRSARSGDVADSIGALIAIVRCVGGAADSDGVEDQNEPARHCGSTRAEQRRRSGSLHR